MSEQTRGEVVEVREELRRDRRWEFRLIAQAALALAIIGAIVWVRQAFFV